ncbi:MAG: bifunctional metallophosphatase/5'-nucleotidase, partial [Stackebrandtia sp.]
VCTPLRTMTHACSRPPTTLEVPVMRSRRPARTLRCALVAAVSTVAAGVGTPAHADEAEPVDVQILSIADLHGYLQPPSVAEGGQITAPGGDKITVGGAAYLATHVKNLREGVGNSLFIAAGDQFSGWPFETSVHRDEPTVEALNALGLDVNAVGNHELDTSRSFLVDHMGEGECFGEIGKDSCFTDSSGQRFHGADFALSTANVVDKQTKELITPPYVVKDVETPDGGTLQVGIVNITPPGTEHGSTSYQTDLETLDPVAAADAYAEELTDQGVNAIVLNVHDGAMPAGGHDAHYNACDLTSGPLLDMAERVSPDIDAIVGGHWHWRFNCMLPDPAGNPRPVVEPGQHGDVVNEINLALDPATGEVLREETTAENHPNTHDVTPDPDMQAIVDYWADQGAQRHARHLADLDGEFTRDKDDSGESTMGNLAADVNMWVADSTDEGRADLAMTMTDPHEGSNAVHGDLTGDAVTEGQVWDVYGYHNPVLTVSVTGEQIDQALEQQWTSDKFAPFAVSDNVSYAFDASRPIGDRVDPADVLVDGEALDPAATYRLAVLAYTAIGGDGITALRDFTGPYRSQPQDRYAFASYLETQGTITPAPRDRVWVKG